MLIERAMTSSAAAPMASLRPGFSGSLRPLFACELKALHRLMVQLMVFSTARFALAYPCAQRPDMRTPILLYALQ